MNKQEAQQLADAIQNEAQQEGLKTTVEGIFPASDDVCDNGYPDGSYFVSIVTHLKDATIEDWIVDRSHWDKIKQVIGANKQ